MRFDKKKKNRKHNIHNTDYGQSVWNKGKLQITHRNPSPTLVIVRALDLNYLTFLLLTLILSPFVNR